MTTQMELKAYKILYETYLRMFMRIRTTACNCVEYRKDKPEEVFKEMEYISNPDKWDYCGILNKQDKAVLETLQYLLNDNNQEIQRYTGWQPMQK